MRKSLFALPAIVVAASLALAGCSTVSSDAAAPNGDGVDAWVEEVVADSGSDAEVVELGAFVPDRLPGEDEADPSKGTISHVSPIARALMGKGVGDTAIVGAGEVEVIAVG